MPLTAAQIIYNYYSGGGGSEPDPGLIWMQENAYVFHDYIKMQGLIGEVVGAEDTGLDDIGPNEIDATPLNNIVVQNYVYDLRPLGCLLTLNDDCISVPITTIQPLLKTAAGHQVRFIIQTDDGISGGTSAWCGCASANSSGNRQIYDIFLSATGILSIIVGQGSTRMFWQSSAAVLADGVNGMTEIVVNIDYENDTLTVFKYVFATSIESSVAGAFATGGDNVNISAFNPANMNIVGQNFYIGEFNNIGTATTRSHILRMFRFAILPLNPSADAVTYFRNLAIDDVWQNRIHVTSSNASAKREALIDVIFPEGTLPTNAVPDATASVSSGAIHGIDVATLSGWTSITRLTFIRDGVSNKVYRIVNSSPNGKLSMWNTGHSLINDVLAIQNLLDNGFDVLYGTAPDTGDTEDLSDNSVSGGPWTPTNAVNNHTEMNGLTAEQGLQYFFFDKVMALNYIAANFSYTEYSILSGVSGGGWLALWLGALDSRWKRVFPIRGFNDRVMWCAGNLSSITFCPDYEQMGANGIKTNSGISVYDFNTNYTQMDASALCATAGRLLKIITHEADTAGNGQFAGHTYETWVPAISTLATQIGGQAKLFLNDAGGEATHSVYQDELDEIFNEL